MCAYFADPARDGIAVVGIGCRFPGHAGSPQEFWQLLRAGVDAVGEVPADRWDAAAYHDPEPGTPGRIASPRGGFLDDVAGFDAPFFGMSPAEAADTDPQQRLALELAWEALEDAGTAPPTLRGCDAGLFMGVKFTDYDGLRARGGPAATGPFTSTGSVEGLIANRVSHFLGLRGPSMAVNASCAGSLIAVHLACQAIRAGECEQALAGGVQLNLFPDTAVGLSQLGVLSPTGRCRTFDAAADGYVRGEGGAVVLLKPYRHAVRDGDRVYCVIRATVTNNNGPNPSLPASSAAGQRHLLELAAHRAGVDPSTIDYVEAHGTGTPVGDRAELAALGAVYGVGRPADRPLLVGSAKTNVGHLEAAAGITGLVKLALCLHHGTIPPSLHLTRPATDPARLGVRVVVARQPWPEPADDRPRRGGVSAFGFGGSNAHAIVEAVPHNPTTGTPAGTPAGGPAGSPAGSPTGTTTGGPGGRPRPVLLTLSARTPAALRARAADLAAHLDRHPDLALPDVALSTGRRAAFAPRIALVAASVGAAAARLRAVDAGTAPGRGAPATPDDLVLVLADPDDGTGDPGPWLAAGRELLRAEPAFATAIDSVRSTLRGLPGSPDLDLDADVPGAAGAARVVFAVQLGLAAVLRGWGLTPAAVTGRGPVGSAAAEYLAGRIPLAVACARVATEGTETGPHATAPAPADPVGHRLPVHLGPAPAGGLGALAAGVGAVESLLSLLGELYLRGVDIDWRRLYPQARIVSLPAYPFERRRHWLAGPTGETPAAPATPAPPARPAPTGTPVDAAGLRASVTGAVAGTLGLDEALVTADTNFETLGMGSLDATELRRRLEAEWGVRIPSATVWGYPTVHQLAAHLHTLLDHGADDDSAQDEDEDQDEELIRLGERLLA